LQLNDIIWLDSLSIVNAIWLDAAGVRFMQHHITCMAERALNKRALSTTGL